MECRNSTEKACTLCGEVKAIDNFSVVTHGYRHSYCRTCRSAWDKKYYHSMPEEQREKIRQRENERRSNWSNERKQHALNKHREWLARNKDYAKEYDRKYREKNKVLLLTGRANQKSKKIGAIGTIKMAEWGFVLNDIFDGKCAASSDHEITEDNQITIDHIQPVASGGRNDVRNIQPLCLMCNLKKGKRFVDFRAEEQIKRINERYPE